MLNEGAWALVTVADVGFLEARAALTSVRFEVRVDGAVDTAFLDVAVVFVALGCVATLALGGLADAEVPGISLLHA